MHLTYTVYQIDRPSLYEGMAESELQTAPGPWDAAGPPLGLCSMSPCRLGAVCLAKGGGRTMGVATLESGRENGFPVCAIETFGIGFGSYGSPESARMRRMLVCHACMAGFSAVRIKTGEGRWATIALPGRAASFI